MAAGAAFALVLALAAWARLGSLGDVLGAGEVIPLIDGDSAYHLIRIRYAVEHFPSLPTVDPAMNWPYGAPCPWADGFDLLGASLARAAGGLGDPNRVDVVAGLLPVFLGLVVVWASMDLARRMARPGSRGARASGVALAAGVLAALLPQAVVSSRYGRVDHHVAEALSMVLLASWALARLGPRGRRGLAVWELAGAGAVAFACWTFTGGPLYVALAAPVVLLGTLCERRPAWLGSGAPALLAGAVAAALLGWPAYSQHGRLLSFQLPSLLQPTLVAVAAAALAWGVAVARLMPDSGWPRRFAAFLLGGAALAAGVAACVPGLAGETVAGVSGWLFHRDPWLAMVDEFQPLWGGGRGLIAGLYGSFGVLGVVAPALVVIGGIRAAPRARARGWAFAGLSAVLLTLSFAQLRFGRVFAPFLAVNAALALEAVAWFALRVARRSRWVGAAVAGLSLLLCAGDPELRGMLKASVPKGLPTAAAAALAIRPRVGSPPEAAPGVLAHWGHGHLVALLSGRPQVLNGFGAYLDEATFWRLGRIVRMDPGEFDRFMEERRVGFVFSGAPFIGPGPLAQTPAGWVLAPEAMRKLPMSPLVIAGSGIPDREVRNLEHLMPIFASEQEAGLAFRIPELWVYERVPGARVTGRGAPGDRAVVEVPFTERGRSHVYRAWSDAGPDGRFEVVVPLPTALARPSLRTAALALVHCGRGEPTPVEIPEEAVRRGGVVEVRVPGRPRG